MENFIFCAVTHLDYSCADWNGLRDNQRDGSWEDVFNTDRLTAASEFC